MNRELVLVVDNVRSTHNVGSFFRTCDGLGVQKIMLCGITPYPKKTKDERLPYLADKINKQIAKTALGAEKTVTWEYIKDTTEALSLLKKQGFQIIVLEQTSNAVDLSILSVKNKVAIVVGNEIDGVANEIIQQADICTEIVMRGQKESLNVSVATGIALYYLHTIAS